MEKRRNCACHWLGQYKLLLSLYFNFIVNSSSNLRFNHYWSFSKMISSITLRIYVYQFFCATACLHSIDWCCAWYQMHISLLCLVMLSDNSSIFKLVENKSNRVDDSGFWMCVSIYWNLWGGNASFKQIWFLSSNERSNINGEKRK